VRCGSRSPIRLIPQRNTPTVWPYSLQHANSVAVFLAEQTLRLNQPAMTSGTVVYADGWIVYAPNVLASHRFQWTIG
jgi:hypothetical protein